MREGGGVGVVGGEREVVGSNRGDSAGGFGGKGNSVRENRRLPPTSMGWATTSQSREGLVRGESVARVSLRKEGGGRGEQTFYKHSVAGESDSESTGYASISFSDSDTGSDDQEACGGAGVDVIADEQEEHDDDEEEVVVVRDLEKELEGVKKGVDRRHEGGEAGVAPGPLLPPSLIKPLVPSVTKPLAASVAKPQGHVGFSSLPDQVRMLAMMDHQCDGEADLFVPC